jgi:heavy metal efflux system protein
MTLGGLAIAVGLLVDAAIIMAENIVHRMTVHRAEGTGKEQALYAAIEVGRPIAFATLIVIAVFLPLFAMSGIEGRIYMPLAAAVIAAIGASLVLALTLVPVGSALLLRPRPEDKPEDVWLVRRLKLVLRARSRRLHAPPEGRAAGVTSRDNTNDRCRALRWLGFHAEIG